MQPEIDVNKYTELMRKIRSKEITQSFSAIRAFSKSPAEYIAYKLRLFEPTEAMDFGTLVDLLLFTPDEFEEKYFVIDDIEVVQKLIEGGYKNARATKDYKNWKEEELQKNNGKKEVAIDDYNLAKRIVEGLNKNEASRWVLDQLGEVQKKLEFEWLGYTWRGVVDGEGESIRMDLKIFADADPNAVQRRILREKYTWQSAVYDQGGGKKDFYFVVADKNGGVSVHYVDRRHIVNAKEEIEYHIGLFQKCALFDEWQASYDFYAPNGIYEL